ncbi:hypothetical protein [Pedobacter mendelii]|uniref:DUF5004 domain-containing protein n=1 Tax=Pedobacter mendelii TaxID=1908240 RepID=A0ABQ2BFH7_9SPHI|nr:hypothetical protein [Pedobacter mendelii]GGI24929.1 hypothetical protein GCM10008119_15110 [Pedobacter mendelii]
MKTLSTYGIVIFLSLFIFSCKKNKDVDLPKDVLTGAWQEAPLYGTSRILIFEPGGKFTLKFINKATGDWSLMLNGKYTITNDNLAVNVTEEVAKQVSGATVTTPINYSFFDKGKFDIKNFVLTINYKTYPADGPVDTEAKFNKIIPID